MSGTEWRLWYRLRSRQLLGHKFRRQVPIGPYVADSWRAPAGVRAVACLEARLVVEVDGEHHGDQLVYDARRDHWLSELGFRVLRFWVVEVDENLEGVIETIVDALSTADVKGPPPTSPRKAGASTQERLDYPGDRTT